MISLPSCMSFPGRMRATRASRYLNCEMSRIVAATAAQARVFTPYFHALTRPLRSKLSPEEQRDVFAKIQDLKLQNVVEALRRVQGMPPPIGWDGRLTKLRGDHLVSFLPSTVTLVGLFSEGRKKG